ncbi:MAG: peroxidase, partial [Planctomycetaceae bacterium]|nr:peroxidase [Planctomycetaceae bacterium]
MAFWQNDRRSRSRRRPTNNPPAQVESFEGRVLLAGVTDDGSVIDQNTLNSLAALQEFASIDGTGNNIDNPELGSTDEALLRVASAEYEDGLSSPAGADRPSAREVSNAIAAVDSLAENDRYLTDFLWIWGQFIDHDIDLTENADPAEALPIEVPASDPFFDPFGTGTETIGFNRSISEVDADGVRQQINEITSFLDGSVIYGSDQERADELRTFEGGLLKTSDGDLLPFNEAGLPNAGGTSESLFLAGDVRANENVALSSMHTIWVREHNRIATELASEDPSLTDEELYQQARAIVTGELQAITYNEFLPALLGFDAISEYQGYDPTVDPSISNLFSTAAYRFGHSLLSPELQRLNSDGSVAAEGNIALQDAFFSPDELIGNGVDSLLQGAATQLAQELDNQVVDDVRNFLFGPPGAGGFDLASLNIQRGRDHGLPDYNQARIDLGLEPVTSFADITSDADLAARLEEVYGDVNNIDVWVGG